MTSGQIVSVFGAANPKPGSSVYTLSEEVGRRLGEAGYTVMTGGYSGTMEAVSKGAKEAGAHVIGVTVSIFEGEGKRPGPNAWVDEVIRYDTLRDRLYHLVTRCDAVVALPGGIGTLSEVALTWSLMQAREIQPIPFVVVGDAWHTLLTAFYGEGEFIVAEYMELWKHARTPEETVSLLQTWTR
jgi:uncharacterized protein (TIGR00730 family)